MARFPTQSRVLFVNSANKFHIVGALQCHPCAEAPEIYEVCYLHLSDAKDLPHWHVLQVSFPADTDHPARIIVVCSLSSLLSSSCWCRKSCRLRGQCVNQTGPIHCFLLFLWPWSYWLLVDQSFTLRSCPSFELHILIQLQVSPVDLALGRVSLLIYFSWIYIFWMFDWRIFLGLKCLVLIRKYSALLCSHGVFP